MTIGRRCVQSFLIEYMADRYIDIAVADRPVDQQCCVAIGLPSGGVYGYR